MHSPTLIALAAILAALVTAVLHLVWRFNKHIPGLGFWVLSFLSASVFGANLLVREQEGVFDQVLHRVMGKLQNEVG